SDYEAALRRFRAGELDVQSRLPTTQIDWLRENMPEVLDIRPVLVIEYYAMNRTREPFDDVRVREALSLALNREAITQQIVRVGNPPAYSIVPPGIANYPGTAEIAFKDMPYPDRVARAQMLIREAGYGPDNRLSTTLAVRSASAEARRIPAAVQQMWRDIYVDVEIVQSDAAVFYNSVQEHDFDIAIAGWVADFNDASNFLDLLRTDNSNNYGLYSNPEYDALLDQAKLEQNLEVRGELMAQAEMIALEDHAWIPASFGVSTSLVHTYVEGWTNNVNDVHRTRYLSIDTEGRAAAMAR
ncbi:MAG: peptide ABC transporter substrate-binding protein, partial [Proteobacteria bacterium]|nr:peptide ABC transporter substrate-binding protein [Pseudomonadota bacterium]